MERKMMMHSLFILHQPNNKSLTLEQFYKMNDDEYWANYIWKNALQKSTLPFKWGFDYRSVKTIDKGTEFWIGAILAATIRIQHEGWSNQYQITLTPDNSIGNPIIVEDVMLQDIVSVIDESIRHYLLYENRYYEDLAMAS